MKLPYLLTIPGILFFLWLPHTPKKTLEDYRYPPLTFSERCLELDNAKVIPPTMTKEEILKCLKRIP